MGDEHPATAQSLYNLGTLLASSAHYAEAEKVLQKSRRILEKSLGPRTEHMAIIYETLSKVYEKMGSVSEAKEYAARAYKVRKPEQMQKPQNN